MENFNLRVGLFIALVLAGSFAFYEYSKKKDDEKKAILATDKVAMTVKINTEYNDEYHSVDLMNVGTSEIYFSIPISKNCIKYDEFNTETKIDVVKVDFIDGKTGETWIEFDGLYQAVCGGKVIYNHSTDGNTETK